MIKFVGFTALLVLIAELLHLNQGLVKAGGLEDMLKALQEAMN